MIDTTPEIAYENSKKLLVRCVLNFRRAHDGNFEEQLAQANLLFMKAYHSYNPEKAKFSTHVWFVVWHGLLEDWREATRKKIMANKHLPVLVKNHAEKVMEDCVARECFDLKTLCMDLSEDARTIVHLLLDMPDGRDDPKRKRSTVIQALLELGWAAGQILKGFREVREALKG